MNNSRKIILPAREKCRRGWDSWASWHRDRCSPARSLPRTQNWLCRARSPRSACRADERSAGTRLGAEKIEYLFVFYFEQKMKKFSILMKFQNPKPVDSWATDRIAIPNDLWSGFPVLWNRTAVFQLYPAFASHLERPTRSICLFPGCRFACLWWWLCEPADSHPMRGWPWRRGPAKFYLIKK